MNSVVNDRNSVDVGLGWLRPVGGARLNGMCVTEVRHPVVQHDLSVVRNKNVPLGQMWPVVRNLALNLFMVATADLPTQEVEIETPMCACSAPILAGKPPALLPIWRAGSVMMDAIKTIAMPSALVVNIGMERNPDDIKNPTIYFQAIRQSLADRVVFVLDPMLATGGSTVKAIAAAKAAGAQDIRVLCFLSVLDGLLEISEKYPDVKVFTAAVDEALDEKSFILPGMGDAGDRIYGSYDDVSWNVTMF